MIELIAHLIGDYAIQDHWMASTKTSRWFPAVVHAALYSVVFRLLFWDASWLAIAIIGSTHLIIDRFRLARFWVDTWGVGKPGVIARLARCDTQDAPAWLGVWLLIIVDNTWHLAINHAALAWL